MYNYTRNMQSAQYYASRTQSSLHAVQSEYETAISNRSQADARQTTWTCVEGEEKYKNG